MAGVKGRSGRRSLADWEKRLKIIDKAWEVAEKYINDESIPLEKRAELACKIIVKDMPEKLTDGQGDPLPVPVINIYGNRNAPDRLIYTEQSIASTTDSGS